MRLPLRAGSPSISLQDPHVSDQSKVWRSQCHLNLGPRPVVLIDTAWL